MNFTPLLFCLGLCFLVVSCTSDDTPTAHDKSTIDVIILDGKVDVSLEKNYEVISEFKNVDSFRVETDTKLQAIFSSKNSNGYLEIIPGIAAERDEKGVEKIYLTLGSEREVAASIKNDFSFQLKVINRPISGFTTRYSHYENIEAFYTKISDPRNARGHVWGGGSTSAFEKRHQQRILEQMELTDIFEHEYDLSPIFASNEDPLLSNLRSFEVGVNIDSLFIIGIEHEALSVQLYGEWKLYNGFDECILTYPIKTMYTTDYYGQENIADPRHKSEFEKVISEAFLNTLTNALLSEEFKGHLTSAEKIHEEDSLRNFNLEKLHLKTKQIGNSTGRRLKENKTASVTVIGEGTIGSGSVISSDGYILTNYHVIANIKDEMEVLFADGTLMKAEIARYDRDLDAAIIKVDTTGLWTTKLAPDYNVEVGEEIFTIATPQNKALINTISFGHVSAFRENGSVRYIQSDGNFLQGVSGGPLFNENGQQIGINVLGWQNNGILLEGINFAIPIDLIIKRLTIQL